MKEKDINIIDLSNELLNDEKISSRLGINKESLKLEIVSRHSMKFRIISEKNKYFIYIHKNESLRNHEKEILKLLENAKIIAPKLILSGKILDHYHNIVSNVDMPALDKLPIKDYDNLVPNIYRELEKLHSITSGNRCLVHNDLHPSNILINDEQVGFLDLTYSTFADELTEFSWIYAAWKVFESRKERIALLYKGLWERYSQKNTFNRNDLIEYIQILAEEKRFAGELADEQFIGRIIRELMDEKY